MRVRGKLTLLLVALLLLAVTATGLLAGIIAQRHLREAATERLVETTLLKEEEVDNWVAARASDLERIVRLAPLGSSLGAGAGAGGLGDPGVQAVQALLEQEVAADQGFRRLLLVSSDTGRVLAATRPDLVGTFRDAEEWFVPAQSGIHVSVPAWSISLGETVMPIAMPVRSEDGATVAILVGHPDLEVIQKILTLGQGAQNTLDSYLVNAFNFFLTEPRYQESSVLRDAVRTDGVEACLAGNSGVDEYLDYREIAVIGAYRWMPDRQACLLTEVDSSEALAALAVIRAGTGGLALGLMAAALVGAVVVARRVTRPILELTEGADRFGRGELDHRLRSTRDDELGDLADAMDRMAADLQQITASRDELDDEVAARRRAEADLAAQADHLQRVNQDLGRSNEELQQFAYVASHDLQEPLRMVSSYVELLARRYRGQLDDDADDFINFAVDGAERMKVLINDLLAFSRVETRGADSVLVRVGDILQTVMHDLEIAIEEAGAQVVVDVGDATVSGDPRQLRQLFQNLISNAIKFRAGAAPRVEVTATDGPDGWEFRVRDNGIGIEAHHFDRIFVIFQRLQEGDVRSGTGIGLAICKKIVLRHHGRIWVESEHGEGSTFHILLPMADPDGAVDGAEPDIAVVGARR